VPSPTLGRELGARRAVTPIHEYDPARAAEQRGALCELAAREDLTVGIGFRPMWRGCNTLKRAAWLIEQVGAPNLGIGVDCLHYVRRAARPMNYPNSMPATYAMHKICEGRVLEPPSEYIPEAHERELPARVTFHGRRF
jgi:sugar phosphate isomerase/epimerase